MAPRNMATGSISHSHTSYPGTGTSSYDLNSLNSSFQSTSLASVPWTSGSVGHSTRTASVPNSRRPRSPSTRSSFNPVKSTTSSYRPTNSGGRAVPLDAETEAAIREGRRRKGLKAAQADYEAKRSKERREEEKRDKEIRRQVEIERVKLREEAEGMRSSAGSIVSEVIHLRTIIYFKRRRRKQTNQARLRERNRTRLLRILRISSKSLSTSFDLLVPGR
jgi:hypothetical protein